jgi:hypothetical protein
MPKLHYEDIQFQEENDKVKGIFLKNFYFELNHSELEKLGKFKITGGDLEIEGKEDIVKRNFNTLLDIKLKELKSIQGKDAVYVYKGFIPLLGCLYFGILDRNTNIIEVRPITGCNLSCIFCSVDLCRRQRDFVVSVDYLIEEFEKLAKLKLQSVNDIEAHINAQGEPLLYSKLPELISGLKKVKGVKTISIDTNGSLLTEKKVDELVDAGLTRFNISLNAFSAETAKKIAGIPYPFENVKKICKYIAKKCDILLAPVLLEGINDSDIEKIIKFSQELKKLRPTQKIPFIGIQNFLEYEHGKKPVKEKSFDEFFDNLAELEKEYKIKLKLSREDFGIVQAKTPKALKKDDVVQAEVICDGMFKNEKLAVAKNRIIAVQTKNSGRIKARITRDKYNIFYAQEI